MLRGDNTGAMVLFNPTEREAEVALPLSGDSATCLTAQSQHSHSTVTAQSLTVSLRKVPVVPFAKQPSPIVAGGSKTASFG